MIKKIKILLIIFISLLLLTVIMLLVVKSGKTTNVNNSVYNNINNTTIELHDEYNDMSNFVVTESEGEYSQALNNTLRKVDSRYDFYSAQLCIKKFYMFWQNIRINDAYTKALYNSLDEEYIQFAGVTEDNVVEKLGICEQCEINIMHMYVQDISNNVSLYIATGYAINSSTLETTDLNIMIKIDKYNDTFAILPYEYMQNMGYNMIYLGESINIQSTERIEDKTYNTFEAAIISDETYAQNLLKSYNQHKQYNVIEAYSVLEQNFKTEYFPTIEEYIQYVNNFDNKILSLKQYKIDEYDGYTKYTCIDEGNNTYTFYETATMEYTVKFDIKEE